MNPSEAWVLLTNRSKHFARSAAGHDAMRSTDVAALLAGLDRHPFMMGMAAECGDFMALKQVELVLWVRAKTLCDSENWDPPHGEFTVRRMVGLALFEAIDDRRCPACNGQGILAFTMDSNPALMFAPSFAPINAITGRIDCSVCAATGQVRLSGRMKARLAGINKDTWSRLWGRRYEPLFSLANGWREEAKQFLAARLRELEGGGQVYTEAKTGTAEAVADKPKNPMQIKHSCAVEKIHGKHRARERAPAANSDPSEVDFRPLQRPMLKLTR